MTMTQIRCFLEVAECLSFSAAAEKLYVSQPSVSRHILHLEQELGFALFRRGRLFRVGGPGDSGDVPPDRPL